MRIFTVTLFVLMLLCGVAVAGETLQAGNEAATGYMPALRSIDFTDQLAQCKFTTFEWTEFKLTAREQHWLRMIEKDTIPEDTARLTVRELKRLGMMELPDGSRQCDFLPLMSALAAYESEFDRLPDSAVELLPYLNRLDPVDIATLSEEELFQKFSVAINPITGRFFRSFASDTWRRGEYSIEIVESAEEIAERWPHHRMPVDPWEPMGENVPPSAVWVLTIYGETRGSVIFETMSMRGGVGADGKPELFGGGKIH